MTSKSLAGSGLSAWLFPNWLALGWELLYLELAAFDSAGLDTRGSAGYIFKAAGLWQSRSLLLGHCPKA